MRKNNQNMKKKITEGVTTRATAMLKNPNISNNLKKNIKKALDTPDDFDTLHDLYLAGVRQLERKGLEEASIEKNMDSNKAIVVKGVKGMKRTPFTKKFKNKAAYERWTDSDAADDFEVTQVMNETQSSNKYNKDAVDKELDRSGVKKPKARRVTHKFLKGHSKDKDKVDEASELKSFKVTYKTVSGKESTCTIKARDKNEAKAKCRQKPNHAGNTVARLKESVRNTRLDRVNIVIPADESAAKFARQYAAGMKGDYREGGPTPADERNSDKFWNMYDSKSIRSGFAGSGETLYTNKKTGETFLVVCSPNGKGFHGTDHFVSKESESEFNESNLTEGVLDDMDDDGFMAKRQLYDLAKYAVELHRMIQDTDNLEPWIQAKITKAADYIDTVKHHLDYQGVRDAEATADQIGPPDLGDIDDVGIDLDSMSNTSYPTEAIVEYGDEEEGSELDGWDILRYAKLRGIISTDSYENASLELFNLADDFAADIGRVYEIGSSDVSIWMSQFVEDLKRAGFTPDGKRAHVYESEHKAKLIYTKMMNELRKR